MAYGEATIRAAIKTAIEAATNEGQVHDYERWMDDWAGLLTLFKSTIDGVDQIRGWTITLERMGQELIGMQGGGAADTVLVTYSYRIRGFMSVDDSEATEKTFVALALSLCEQLEAAAGLTGAVLEREEPVVAECRIDYAMLAGVLCHRAEIMINPQEVV